MIVRLFVFSLLTKISPVSLAAPGTIRSNKRAAAQAPRTSGGKIAPIAHGPFSGSVVVANPGECDVSARPVQACAAARCCAAESGQRPHAGGACECIILTGHRGEE